MINNIGSANFRPVCSEIEQHIRAAETSSLSAEQVTTEVLDGLLHTQQPGQKVRLSTGILRLWRSINGDIERKHTLSVFLNEPKKSHYLPTLVVMVDSKSRETDFMANRELYRSRLAAHGLEVEEVIFKLSKRSAVQKKPEQKRTTVTVVTPTNEEIEEAKRTCKDVPEHLFKAVVGAMSASLARSRHEGR